MRIFDFRQAFFALSVASVFLLFSGCSRDAPPPSEAMLTELVRVDGRLHADGNAEPFTGVMLEHYPDGTIKSRSELVDGVLHGISEGWHANGTLQVRESFVAGVSHGTRARWYPNGVRQSEAEIVHGRINGVFLRWRENGVPAERIEMKNGEPDGVSEAYFSSGYLKARVEISDGRIVEQIFWEDGEMGDAHFVQGRGDLEYREAAR